MKTAPIALLVATLVLSVGAVRGFTAQGTPTAEDVKADKPQDKASLWMRHKLIASEKILEGMTRGDFAMIENNAKGMEFLTYLEAWSRADMPEYQAQLHAFEHANGSLVRAAMDKNLDRVTLAYTQLTISCVQCHQIVRDKVKN